ncbi:MAG: hypothetical protein ACTSSK_08180 [Candidatus Heimdallarchaeota archaeon]
MRKITSVIIVLMITAFVNPVSLSVVSQNNTSFPIATVELNINDETTTIHPDKMSYENATWAQFTTTAFTPDGNITEWDTEGILAERFEVLDQDF